MSICYSSAFVPNSNHIKSGRLGEELLYRRQTFLHLGFIKTTETSKVGFRLGLVGMVRVRGWVIHYVRVCVCVSMVTGDT